MKANGSRKRIPMATIYFALVAALAVAAAPVSYAYWAGGVLVRDTHCVITLRAMS